jgi:hypothetical protein
LYEPQIDDLLADSEGARRVGNGSPATREPRSTLIGSKKTDTPAVCPGMVMNEPNAPAARITQP